MVIIFVNVINITMIEIALIMFMEMGWLKTNFAKFVLSILIPSLLEPLYHGEDSFNLQNLEIEIAI